MRYREVDSGVVGLSKIIGIRKCSFCNNDIEVRNKERMARDNIFCNTSCQSNYRKNKLDLNVSCSYCGLKFHLKPSKLIKYDKHYCSIECNKKDKSIYMSGEGNHQYGLKGNLNNSWKSDSRITNYGYKKIRYLEHPFADCDGFVLEHRLIAEQYLLNDVNSVCINGKLYLSDKYEVHHVDKNRLNNSKSNLLILTKSEHMSLHMEERFGSSGK